MGGRSLGSICRALGLTRYQGSWVPACRGRCSFHCGGGQGEQEGSGLVTGGVRFTYEVYQAQSDDIVLWCAL